MNDYIISTAYLPPIAFFVAVCNSEIISIEANENYQKQTYRNRCHILTANGILPLSIPVNKSDGNHTLIKNIKISYLSNWQLNHWRAIESAYNKSPFFLYYKDDFEKILMKNNKFLIDFNTELLLYIFKKLGFDIKTNYTSDFHPFDNETFDIRSSFNPKINDQLTYPNYYQVFGIKYGFSPNLSIIDLLFNEGPEARNYIKALFKIT